VVTAYSILFGSLLVVSGRVADRIGRRRVFFAGTLGFVLGSILSAAAPGLGWLVAGRVVQGAGAALLTPASLGLLLAAFPAERRTQIVALNAGVGALGVASGPTLGALLIAASGWRAAFWINLPICAAALLLGRRSLIESEPQRTAQPDYPGAVLVTVAVAALVLGIAEGETWGWTSPAVVACFLTAAALGAGFVVRSRRHPEPMLPPALFAEPTFRWANIASFTFGAGFAGMALTNVLFLRTIWGYGVVRAGLFSVLAPLVVAVVSTQAGKLARRVGFRPLLVAGPLLFVAGELGCVLLLDVHDAPWTRWVPLGIVLGVGIGLTFPGLAAASVARLPPTRFALGGAVNNTFRQVGSAVGVAAVVAAQSSVDGIDGFRAAWLIAALGALSAAAVSLYQPGRAALAAAPAPPTS
jgi:EmrB/QacA subfamily drug resistance transporter